MTQECSTWAVLLPGVKQYTVVLQKKDYDSNFVSPYLSMKPDSNNVILLQGQQMGSHQVGVLLPTDVDSALPS